MTAPERKSVEATALMEQQLTGVEHGEQDAENVMEQFRKDARSIADGVRESVETNGGIIQSQQGKRAMASYGPCPECGRPVIRKGKFWQCSTNKREKRSDGTWVSIGDCGWKLHQTVCGKNLTAPMVRALLEEQRVHARGFTSKAGKKFSADLIPDQERGVKLDFGK